MSYNLTLQERETIINFNEADAAATPTLSLLSKPEMILTLSKEILDTLLHPSLPLFTAALLSK